MSLAPANADLSVAEGCARLRRPDPAWAQIRAHDGTILVDLRPEAITKRLATTDLISVKAPTRHRRATAQESAPNDTFRAAFAQTVPLGNSMPIVRGTGEHLEPTNRLSGHVHY